MKHAEHLIVCAPFPVQQVPNVQEAATQDKAEWLRLCFAKPIAFHRAFATIADDTLSGLFLSQAFYWSSKTSDIDGWFYKTQEEWEEETTMKRREQETSRRNLRRIGVLEEKKQGVPARLYYKINIDILHARMAESAIQGWRKAPYRDGGKRQAISEITSEITSERENLDKNLSFPGVENGSVFPPGQQTAVTGVAPPSVQKKRPAKTITPIDVIVWPNLVTMLTNFELPLAPLNDNDFWAALTYTCPPVQQDDWLEAELANVYLWLKNNPHKRPASRWQTFLGNWLKRAYEHYRKTLFANKQAQSAKRY